MTLSCPGGDCRRQAAELSASPASRRVKVCGWRMGEPVRFGVSRAQRFPHQEQSLKLGVWHGNWKGRADGIKGKQNAAAVKRIEGLLWREQDL